MESIKKRVEQAVNEIYSESGMVTSTALLNAARPDDSAIHDAFEWDDGKAGHEYRLMQARKWIRIVMVFRDEQPAERLVHVPTTSGGGYYKPASIIVQDVDEYAAAMSAVKMRLAAAKESLEDLKSAAKENKPARVPNFNLADRGFDMVKDAIFTA